MFGELRKLIQSLNVTDGDYVKLNESYSLITSERIKLIGNQMRQALGRPIDPIDKTAITNSIININDIASKHGSNFNVPTDWEHIENFLRMSILEDISNEFKKQEDQNK